MSDNTMFLEYLGDIVVEDTVNTSKVVEETFKEEKKSNKLVVHDILMLNKVDRLRIIPMLQEIYGIDFIVKSSPVEYVVTFTSQKCILEDSQGNKYFFKEKPFYCLEEEKLEISHKVQATLAENTDFVPEIIKTRKGSPYCAIGTKTFILTPFIEGSIYTGKLEESVEASKTLGVMHRVLNKELDNHSSCVSAYQDAMFFINLLSQHSYNDIRLHKKIVSLLTQLAERYKDGLPSKTSWLHGDFTPFNLIYKDGNVIGVNDFDNANFGSLSRDLGECILKHTGVCYAGATSSFRSPIPKVLDEQRMQAMITAYLEENNLSKVDLEDLGIHTLLIWVESLALGLVRGDYSLQDVEQVIDFGPVIVEKFNDLLYI